MNTPKQTLVYASLIVVAVAVVGLTGWALFRPHQAKASCESPQIKGNTNQAGTKIYHIPGGKFYNLTVIDAGTGEQMFCTENEAAAAGFRKSAR